MRQGKGKKEETMQRNLKERKSARKIFQREKKDVGIQEKWEDMLPRRSYDGFAVSSFMI